ncbi:maltokinase N-terminal cap-like domain-containing protein [Streptomyces chilikensis]|uniref:maltokinase N-terminal cap-like domain-containing protein n=1 Tax=Streptomyces chilikensis TaxID=1194079 RepID=UPI0014085EF7|nr:maltokinase [Streptomyces chilikensis]
MSEVSPYAPARSAVPGQTLPASLGPLLLDWLPRRRWFAGKGSPLSHVSVVAETELLPLPASGNQPGLVHLLVRAGRAPGDCYQLLLGVRRSLPPHLAPALAGHLHHGPFAGAAVYDALHDPRATGLLLEALRSRARVGGLRFEREGEKPLPLDGAPRLITSEQSNSSVVYGDALILKLLRRVTPGVNPDLELPLALAREGCSRVPAPAGWLTADLPGEAEPYVLAVLQPFLRGADDGWQLALARLAQDRDFTAEARALGHATAEVHLSLARALPTVTLGRAQLSQMVEGMCERLDAAVQAVPALVPYADGLRSAYTALADLASEGRTWTAQRIHGDLHLGQCLRTPDGEWSLIDFEGEPSRPLAERRLEQPAVRDVAGMLRSFDYAAHAGRPWPPGWADACRAAFCTGYAEATGSDPRTDPVMLRACETEKAVYEVVYEARHRPDWLRVPLAAIQRLSAGATGEVP